MGSSSLTQNLAPCHVGSSFQSPDHSPDGPKEKIFSPLHFNASKIHRSQSNRLGQPDTKAAGRLEAPLTLPVRYAFSGDAFRVSLSRPDEGRGASSSTDDTLRPLPSTHPNGERGKKKSQDGK